MAVLTAHFYKIRYTWFIMFPRLSYLFKALRTPGALGLDSGDIVSSFPKMTPTLPTWFRKLHFSSSHLEVKRFDHNWSQTEVSHTRREWQFMGVVLNLRRQWLNCFAFEEWYTNRGSFLIRRSAMKIPQTFMLITPEEKHRKQKLTEKTKDVIWIASS